MCISRISIAGNTFTQKSTASKIQYVLALSAINQPTINQHKHMQHFYFMQYLELQNSISQPPKNKTNPLPYLPYS